MTPFLMTPEANIAQWFLRRHLRLAKYSLDFIEWAKNRRFPNPNPKGRLKDVKFNSLPQWEQQRIYSQWAKTQQSSNQEGPQGKQETPEQETARNVDLARNGKVVSSKSLSSGANTSYVVQLEKDGRTETFLYKPAGGEERNLRNGVMAGTYHRREQAAYAIDTLLGGKGIVPVTQTRGDEDGSYQLWAHDTKALHGDSFDEIAMKIPLKGLRNNESFQRLNILDLLIGHQDRHAGNLLATFDGGEPTPKNLRFIAIDNGLSLAAEKEDLDDDDFSYVYETPFNDWHMYNEDAVGVDESKQAGDEEVAHVLMNISDDLRNRLKGIKLRDMAHAMTDAGVDEEVAVRAALTRLVALQENPDIFEIYFEDSNEDLSEAWRSFQRDSTETVQGENRLLQQAGILEKQQTIDEAVKEARPERGWWRSLRSMMKRRSMNVTERWLLANATPKQVAVHVIDVNTLKPSLVGMFTLDGDQVIAKYEDPRFQREIERGVRIQGKRVLPKDGAEFLDAVRKVYGSRTLYDVHLS